MTSTSFDEVEAAAKLGFPGEAFQSITPDELDGLYWIVIGTDEKRIARPVIAVDGHVVTDTGYRVGMGWLRRVAAKQKPTKDVWYVSKVLRWYDALPIGWNESAQSDPLTKETGSVTFHPIEVKLVSGVDIPAQSRTQGPPGAPRTSSGGPPGGGGGGPGIPVGMPPGGAGIPGGPPGGGPGIPGGMQPGGPPGGYAPARPCRAILRELNGKLTWLVESYDPSTKQWVEKLRESAE